MLTSVLRVQALLFYSQVLTTMLYVIRTLNIRVKLHLKVCTVCVSH